MHEHVTMFTEQCKFIIASI